ncbi:hypothetical protein B0O99DRAFT_609837 [Bisporella sp. PMI_857]|nr:hypothetical protein B0O99DRAFT_609837 [Bisporella sp. PMI_857]
MSSKGVQNVKGASIYKKKEGTLSISKDQTSLIWVPLQPRDAPPGVSIKVADIANLQQTPESAAKVMLRIVEKSPGATEPTIHTFNFNSPTNPRGEANAVKDVLTSLISAIKASDASIPRPNGQAAAAAATSTANSVLSMSESERWYDDAQLKADIELQQSLMKKDPVLHRTYMESRRTKPDTITDSQFNAHFWSTRTNILRAHAVEIHQKRGSYNVLSSVKPRQVDGELKMNISAEQVSLIFSQHPLVKQVYDENVPKLNEMDFWSRFFLSRLFKKLKGERITENDGTDPTFDRYLDKSNEDMLVKKRQAETQIPHVIDLEGNEENQGGAKSGNKKDFTMIPSSTARVPIIRTLNSLSEKIMAHVAPSDIDPANPVGMDESTFNSLVLRDLRGNEEENRILLNIKQQSQFLLRDKSEVSEEAKLYANQVPSEVLLELEGDLADTENGIDLRTAIGVLEDSDSEDEEKKVPHVGSKKSLMDAQKHIMEGVSARRVETLGTSTKSSLAGLSEKVFTRLMLTHATTTEFLNHFWLIFLSGDVDRAGELAKMVESLDRAMDRINAVAAEAEKERQEIIARQRQHIKDVYAKSQKKIQWHPNSVGGGEKVVKEMMESIIKALSKASSDYRRALAAEGMDTS